MAIVQAWDNEDQTVMRQTFSGWWTVDEYCNVFRAFQFQAMQHEHTVHYIADFSKSEGLLGNLLGVVHEIESCAPLNLGVGVAVRASYQTETLFTIAKKVCPQVYGSLLFVNSLQEAREMIWLMNHSRNASVG